MLITYESPMAPPDAPTHEPYLPLLPKTGLETLGSHTEKNQTTVAGTCTRMNGWMDGWIDEWAWMDGRMEGWIDGHGWMDGWIDGRIDEW